MPRISATEAARKFSDLINRVRYQGAHFEIARGGEVVARIVPAGPPATVRLDALDNLLSGLPRLETKEADSFAKDLEDIRRQARAPVSGWD